MVQVSGEENIIWKFTKTFLKTPDQGISYIFVQYRVLLCYQVTSLIGNRLSNEYTKTLWLFIFIPWQENNQTLTTNSIKNKYEGVLSKTGHPLGFFCHKVLLQNNMINLGGGVDISMLPINLGPDHQWTAIIKNGLPPRVEYQKYGSVILRGDRVLDGDKNWVYKEKQTRNKIALNIDP